MNHKGHNYTPLNKEHSLSMQAVPCCTNKNRNIVPLQPEDEQVLNIINSLCDNSLGECLSEVLSFGPRCTRCGMPCGCDTIYFGSMAFHKKHFNCKICGSSIDFPIVIDNDICCQKCLAKIKKESTM